MDCRFESFGDDFFTLLALNCLRCSGSFLRSCLVACYRPGSTQTINNGYQMLNVLGQKERLASPPPPPPYTKIRIVKTPIPSSGSTPMPLSSSSITDSGTDGGIGQDSEVIDNLVGAGVVWLRIGPFRTCATSIFFFSELFATSD